MEHTSWPMRSLLILSAMAVFTSSSEAAFFKFSSKLNPNLAPEKASYKRTMLNNSFGFYLSFSQAQTNHQIRYVTFSQTSSIRKL